MLKYMKKYWGFAVLSILFMIAEVSVDMLQPKLMAKIVVLDNGTGYMGARVAGASGWGSTGLGLAFTRRVLSLHGGSFLIADRTDGRRGAKAALYIPLAPRAAGEQIEAGA